MATATATGTLHSTIHGFPKKPVGILCHLLEENESFAIEDFRVGSLCRA
jgi:hypothetical protein